jgi:hypothetical protein
MYGIPQAAAWNIGTTGSTQSFAPSPIASLVDPTSAWRTVERCEYTTPFG